MGTERRRLRPLAIWFTVLAAGCVLLWLRYDHDIDGGATAERATVLSAYLLAIALPTLYYLARWILRDARAAAALTGVAFVVATMPYELLGLDGLYYYADDDHLSTIEEVAPQLEFLPGGRLSSFPHDWLFVPLLFATGAGIVWGVWRLRARAGWIAPRTIPVLLTVAFAAICVQASLHTSMRAPYTYLPVFQRPAAAEHWYHLYHFEDGRGASIADQIVFTPLEDVFQGSEDAADANNSLIRRPFSFYVASQFSYFANTFYAWLALNCLFWLAAVFAIGRLVWRWATPRAGVIAAALTAVGPGFIAFVGTPAMYLQSYAFVAIALCLFEDLVVRARAADRGKLALFTGALALSALVYDLTPFFVVLLAYGLARRLPPGPLLAALGSAYALAWGFDLVVRSVLGIEVIPSNTEQLSDVLRDFNDFLVHPGIGAWYEATVDALSSWIGFLLQAFFVLPVLLAVAGIAWVRDRSLRVLVAAFALANLALIALFRIGDEEQLRHLPRLVYVIFPAVYLLAAVALERFSRPRAPASAASTSDALRGAAPWLVVAAMFVLGNVDIFGYPSLYVEFFIGVPPDWTP